MAEITSQETVEATDIAMGTAKGLAATVAGTAAVAITEHVAMPWHAQMGIALTALAVAGTGLVMLGWARIAAATRLRQRRKNQRQSATERRLQ